MAELQFNREVLGKRYEAGPYHITRETVLDYLHSVGETNPLYTGDGRDGKLSAPHALLNIFFDDWESPDLDIKFEGVNYKAGHWLEPLAPIKAGDVIGASFWIKDVFAKTGRSGPMAFIHAEGLLTNQDGVDVAQVGFSSVLRKES